MSDFRRQKRKAIRESKDNFTNTKIEDNLAVALDGYLRDDKYFKKQLDICFELKMDYPKDAKTGYELPLFNKNPITNEIEIHAKSADLFTAYQLTQRLADSTVGLDDKSKEYESILVYLFAIDTDPLFATYLHELMQVGKEKNKDFSEVVADNLEDISKRIDIILESI